MAHTVTFDTPQDIIEVAEVKHTSISSGSISDWVENKDVGGDYRISCKLHFMGRSISGLLNGNQTRLKEIMDGSDTAENKKAAVVKEAVQTGDYK
jgi:hypothetical protein